MRESAVARRRSVGAAPSNTTLQNQSVLMRLNYRVHRDRHLGKAGALSEPIQNQSAAEIMFLSLDAPLQTRPRTRVLLLPKFELDKEHRGSVAAVQGSRKGALAFVAGSDVGVCPDVPIGFGAR